MSNVIWKVNGTPVADLGISVAGGTFKTQGTSFALLDVVADFDAAEVFTYGQAITLTRTLADATVTVFNGKIAPISKQANPEYEGHKYPVEDAWADLERTTYQEEWATGRAVDPVVSLPRAVLGIDSDGLVISVGLQLAAIIGFAATVGVAIQMGSTPSGEDLWPKEVNNISCAEAINQCLEFHPDWVPWLDHTTTPPTFNVTDTLNMPEVILPTDGSGILASFEETRRDDLVPDTVRIVYEFATTIEDEVFRNLSVDKAPGGGPDAGPKVLCAMIPLAGGQMQIQKSRVRVRPMPESDDLSDLTKKWVKANYPRLKDVDLEDFVIKRFKKTLHVDDIADHPHPLDISKQAPRLVATDADQVPNQLLEGQIEDWMRKKVAWVDFEVIVSPADGVSPEVQSKINLDFPPGKCVCTNAITKLYKGVTQWVADEDIPSGIAAGVYNSMSNAYLYEGSAKILENELSGTRYHGKKLTLTGAGTSNAMIHSVTWDVGSGETTLGFGPVPELAPADFLELQRRLRSRKVTWWSGIERTDSKLGAEAAPSAAGDTVGGYHGPQIIFGAQPKPRTFPFAVISIKADGDNFKVTLQPGWVRDMLTQVEDGDDADAVAYHMPTYSGTALDDVNPPAIGLAVGSSIYIKYLTDKTGAITDTPTVEVSADPLITTHYQPLDGDGEGGEDGTYHINIGTLKSGGESPVWLPRVGSDIVHWHELWTGTNLGDGAKLYKKRDPELDEFQFRTLKGRFGINYDEQDEEVQLDVDAENIGDGVAVLKLPEDSAELPDEPLRFRTLRGLQSGDADIGESEPQIQVNIADGAEEGDESTIRIRGNEKNGSISFVDCSEERALIFKLEWKDGLIVSEDDREIQVGCDGSGTSSIS